MSTGHATWSAFLVFLALSVLGWLLVVGPTFDPCAPVRAEIRAALIRAEKLSSLAAPFVANSLIDATAAVSGHRLTGSACLAADWELFSGHTPALISLKP